MPGDTNAYFLISQYTQCLSLTISNYSSFYSALKDYLNLFQQEIEDPQSKHVINKDEVRMLEEQLERLDESFFLFFESSHFFLADQMNVLFDKEKRYLSLNAEIKETSQSSQILLECTTQFIEHLNRFKDWVDESILLKKPTFFEKLQLTLLNFFAMQRSIFNGELFRLKMNHYKFIVDDLTDKETILEKSVGQLKSKVCTEFFKPLNKSSGQTEADSVNDEHISDPPRRAHQSRSFIV